MYSDPGEASVPITVIDQSGQQASTSITLPIDVPDDSELSTDYLGPYYPFGWSDLAQNDDSQSSPSVSVGRVMSRSITPADITLQNPKECALEIPFKYVMGVFDSLVNGRGGLAAKSAIGNTAWFTKDGAPHIGGDRLPGVKFKAQVEVPNGSWIYVSGSDTFKSQYSSLPNYIDADAIYAANEAQWEQEVIDEYKAAKNITSPGTPKNVYRFLEKAVRRKFYAYISSQVENSNTKVATMYFHDSPLSSSSTFVDGVRTYTYKNGSFLICANTAKMKIMGGIEGWISAMKKAGLVKERYDPQFRQAALKSMEGDLAGAGGIAGRKYVFLRFTPNAQKILGVGKHVGIILSVLAAAYTIYVAQDKVEAVVELVGGLAGASMAEAGWQGLMLFGGDETPPGWAVNAVGILVVGPWGYTHGSKQAEEMYEVHIHRVNGDTLSALKQEGNLP
jgi:hypothetical protein